MLLITLNLNVSKYFSALRCWELEDKFFRRKEVLDKCYRIFKIDIGDEESLSFTIRFELNAIRIRFWTAYKEHAEIGSPQEYEADVALNKLLEEGNALFNEKSGIHDMIGKHSIWHLEHGSRPYQASSSSDQYDETFDDDIMYPSEEEYDLDESDSDSASE